MFFSLGEKVMQGFECLGKSLLKAEEHCKCVWMCLFWQNLPRVLSAELGVPLLDGD